jgi:hypothetical protein
VIPDAQTLSLSGTSLSISNGNTVSIPANTDNQTLTLSGNSLSISNGNSVTLPTSLDNDTTNELQSIYLDTLGYLRITKSNSFVQLPLGSVGSVGAPVKNVGTSNYCFYETEGIIDIDTIPNATVAYNSDSIIVLFVGEAQTNGFVARFHTFSKGSKSIINTQTFTNSTFSGNSNWSNSYWKLAGYYRPNRYVILMGYRRLVYNQSGQLIYQTGSTLMPSGSDLLNRIMGDSLIFQYTKSSASSTNHYSRDNIYTGLTETASISTASSMISFGELHASHDELTAFFGATANLPKYWPKGMGMTVTATNKVRRYIKLNGGQYGINRTAPIDPVYGTNGEGYLNLYFSPNSNILSVDPGSPREGMLALQSYVGKNTDSTTIIVSVTKSSQLFNNFPLSINIPTQPSSNIEYLVIFKENVLTGEVNVLDIIKLYPGSPLLVFEDSSTDLISYRYRGKCCFNGQMYNQKSFIKYY